MLKIEVKIDELYLRLDCSCESEKIFAQIQFLDKHQWIKLGKKVQMTSPNYLHNISIAHIVFVRKQQIQTLAFKFKVILICQKITTQMKYLKYGGDCQIQLKKFDFFNPNFPLSISQNFPLTQCPDKKAYLKFTIKIQELQDFRNLQNYNTTLLNKQNEQIIEDKQILLQQQKQRLEQTKKQSQRIENRNKRLSSEIQHLKQQNRQLEKQIKQKNQAIKIDQQLKEDKLDLLIKRKINAEQTYKKAKQNIAKVFNLINEYGNPNLIEQFTILLTRNS